MPLFTRRTPATLVAPAPPAATLPALSQRSLLRPLGIVGYDAIEPTLLAALATEEPLLLVSDHGAAKTLLLVRLAEALLLDFRHYNASLLQFDDLVGFPIPDERTGEIRYAAPPGAIWGAEAVFFDEIGRCRVETANKLFPLVHERRIQGIALTQLRYRWAATNPPVEALEADRANDAYEGVELLDPALADRFAWVVPLARFHELSDVDRLAVIRGVGEVPAPGSGAPTRKLVPFVPCTNTASDGTATFYFAPGARARVDFDGRSIQPNHWVLGWYSKRAFAKDFNPTARPSRKASRFTRHFGRLVKLVSSDMRALVDGSAYTGGGWSDARHRRGYHPRGARDGHLH